MSTIIIKLVSSADQDQVWDQTEIFAKCEDAQSEKIQCKHEAYSMLVIST